MRFLRAALPVAAGAATIVILAGCGTERATAPVPTAADAPVGEAEFEDPSGDVSLDLPGNWAQRPGEPPIVLTAFSGRAILSVYAYRRRAVPVTEEDLETARRRVVQTAERRDETFEAFSSRVREIAGTPAVEVVGVATVAERRVRVRSVHLFRDRGEYVIDAIAPPADFDRVDEEVFRPVIRTVRVGGDPPAGD